MTHTSWLNEAGRPERSDNERLEFLGDAVLALVVSDLLMRRFPDRARGRSVARAGGAGQRERSGAGRRSRSISGASSCSARARSAPAGGRVRRSWPNALEALMGAIYLDGGFDAVAAVGGAAVRSARSTTSISTRGSTTSRACRSARRRCWQTAPVYEVVAEDGPDHDKRFEVALSLAGREYGRAQSAGRRRRRSRARRRRRWRRSSARSRESEGVTARRCSDAQSPPTCWRSAGGCATPATRRTWSAAACATCCSAGRRPTSTSPPTPCPEAVRRAVRQDLRDPDRPQARHGHRADRHRAAAPRRGDDVSRRGRLPRRPPPVVGHVRQVARRGSERAATSR